MSWGELSKIAQMALKAEGKTIEDVRVELKEYRKNRILKSLGSVSLNNNLDIQEIYREVKGK